MKELILVELNYLLVPLVGSPQINLIKIKSGGMHTVCVDENNSAKIISNRNAHCVRHCKIILSKINLAEMHTVCVAAK